MDTFGTRLITSAWLVHSIKVLSAIKTQSLQLRNQVLITVSLAGSPRKLSALGMLMLLQQMLMLPQDLISREDSLQMVSNTLSLIPKDLSLGYYPQIRRTLDWRTQNLSVV